MRSILLTKEQFKGLIKDKKQLIKGVLVKQFDGTPSYEEVLIEVEE